MKKNFTYLTSFLIKFFIFLIFLFARTLTGISIFGFRLGEYFIGFCFVLIIFYSFIIPLFKKEYFLNDKKLNIYLCLLVISFFLSNLISGESLYNPFIYKTSSYIWSFGALIIGYKLLIFINFKIYKSDIYFSFLGLFVIYLFSTKGISQHRQNILMNFTDKFEYPKGSDLLLACIFVFYLFLEKKSYSKNSFFIFFMFCSLLTPLFLVKSRSGFISLLIFAILTLPIFKRKILTFDYSFLLVFVFSVLIFVISTSWVVSKDIVIDEEIDSEIKYAITSRYRTINDNTYEREVLKLKLFYFEDGRLFSSDGNLNWRFQIWQDIFSDMKGAPLLIGYGYSDIIPAMDSDQRLGQDRTNINVHNYFVHILSRGGILHVYLVITIYYLLYKKFTSLGSKSDYYLIILPLIFNSLFDPSMENAHYPIILFILVGLAFHKPIILNKDNL